MLLLVLAKDEDVIHMAKNTFLPCEDLVHSSLEVLRGARNAKGQPVEAVAPERGDEGGKDLDCPSRGICQNPQLASSLLKAVAPAIWARVSSTLGRGCTSHRTLSFSVRKSTQMQTAPDFLGTTTMPAHHGVSSSTREITGTPCG